VDVEEPRRLHLGATEIKAARRRRWFSRSLNGSASGERRGGGAGGIARDGTLESSIETEGGSGAEVEVRGVNSGVGAGSGSATGVRKDSGAPAAGRRATGGGGEGRRPRDGGVDLADGRLGLEDGAGARRGGKRPGGAGWGETGSRLVGDVEDRGLEDLLGEEAVASTLGPLGENGRVDVFKVVLIQICRLSLG